MAKNGHGKEQKAPERRQEFLHFASIYRLAENKTAPQGRTV
jgi:hypothetical protein